MTALRVLLAGAERIDGSRRRLRFVGDDLDGFACRAGQHVAAIVQGRGGPLRLLCEVEQFDAAELRLETILAVETDPVVDEWCHGAQIGDPVDVELVGSANFPRGTTEALSRVTSVSASAKL